MTAPDEILTQVYFPDMHVKFYLGAPWTRVSWERPLPSQYTRGLFHIDSATTFVHLEIIRRLRSVQSLTGWSDDVVADAWYSFCGNPIWKLFDGHYVAIAFHAIVVLQIIVDIGPLAWEQVQNER